MKTHPNMNDFFSVLDRWRHFPAFPLEPRSEVLFALFLPGALEDCINAIVKPRIIPQFPIKHESTNQSDKVDFFALSKDGKCAFLIELKTDVSSRRTEQDVYLARAAKKGMDNILYDLKSIVQASTEKRKYYHLLSALSELDLISLPDNLKSEIYSGNSGALKSAIDEISILNSPRIEVVYVQPRRSDQDKSGDGQHYIDFDELADSVGSKGDMGGLFADYLRKWITDPAIRPPR